MRPRPENYAHSMQPHSVSSATGQHIETGNYKTITYPLDKYDIVVRLTLENEFVDIIEVRIKKDFLSYKQKIAPKGFHDVEEFYRDE